jgi:HAD superfamily hydrolase (TIGR01549 family)
MIKSIIFDFDGVLSASEGIGRKIIFKVLKNENLYDKIIFDDNQKITNNGKPIKPGTSIHDILKLIFPEKGDYLFEKWYEEFDNNFLDHIKLLDGVEDSINYFYDEGYDLYIVSTKYKSLIVKALKHFKLEDKFKFVVGREVVNNPKPNPEPFNFLKEKFDLKKETSIYVGDTITDQLFAENCGLKFIYFESNIEKSIVTNYYKKITNFSELVEIINKLNKN